MSKKKKKAPPQSAAQKRLRGIRNAVTDNTGRAIGRMERTAAAVRTACAAAERETARFLRCKWSCAVLTALFLLLMYATYLLFGHAYLTKTFPLSFAFAIPFYLIDFRVGFLSRVLVGQIVALFTDKVSLSLIFAVSRTAVILSLALQAALAAAVFRKAFLKGNRILAALCVFVAASPITVVPMMLYLGFLDVYNLLLAIVYVYISDTRAAPFLTPLICVTGVIIHYHFALAFLPVILTLELYRIIKQKDGRALRTVSLCMTVILTGAAAVYLVFFSAKHIRIDADTLLAAMQEKFTDYKTWGLYDDYFLFNIYGDYNGMNYSAPADTVSFLFRYALDRLNRNMILHYLAALLPFFAAAEYFWICAMKKSGKGMRFAYFLFMLQPLVFAVSAIVSTDTGRWACAALFSHFALLTAAEKHDGEIMAEAARRLQKLPVILPMIAVLIAGYVIALYTVKTFLN